MSAVAAYWREIVTVGLLGTDRREPPAPVPGLLADLAADDQRPSPSLRLLQQAAACTVIRRAGVRPAPAGVALAAPAEDLRPATPPPATATWRRIVTDWPVLEDEWVLSVITGGWRLAPELVATLLARHRTDAVRRARIQLAAGPLADWLVGHQPQLAGSAKHRPAAEAVGSLAELSMLPELAAILGAAPAEVVRIVAGGMDSGSYGVAHRGVLTNFVARVQRAALAPLGDALERIDPSRPAIGLAFALADLTRLRAAMLTELEPG